MIGARFAGRMDNLTKRSTARISISSIALAAVIASPAVLSMAFSNSTIRRKLSNMALLLGHRPWDMVGLGVGAAEFAQLRLKERVSLLIVDQIDVLGEFRIEPNRQHILR